MTDELTLLEVVLRHFQDADRRERCRVLHYLSDWNAERERAELEVLDAFERYMVNPKPRRRKAAA